MAHTKRPRKDDKVTLVKSTEWKESVLSIVLLLALLVVIVGYCTSAFSGGSEEALISTEESQ